jgi:cob(I)alamin adenosyltransferase
MKLYTKTGDKGNTSLYTGERVAKDSIRVEAYGTIDEFDAALGMARALCRNKEVGGAIYEVQKLLPQAMAVVASVADPRPELGAETVRSIEMMIDNFDASLAPLTHFLIPGGKPGAAALDVARTVARRAERQLWRLAREESVDEQVLILLNRLSDLCFVLARAENELEG